MAVPIFRDDFAELSPVEALADPHGLDHRDFAVGGRGQSYELRCQRQTGRSGNATASLAYQRVHGLMVEMEDPALAALPVPALVDRGHRWVADVSYEQSVCDNVTGRGWAQWQDTRGVFPSAGAMNTQWPYAPEWQAGTRVDYIGDSGLRVGLEGVWRDDRFHDPGNSLPVAGAFVVNMRAQYQRNTRENYYVDVQNLLGRDYENYAGYPESDLSVVGGFDYRF